MKYRRNALFTWEHLRHKKWRKGTPLLAQQCFRYSNVGLAARMDARRASISLAQRLLCAWKNASRVVVRARLTAASVGQRVRKSQNSTVSLSSNHSRACG